MMKNALLVSFEIGWGQSIQEREDYNRIYSACEKAIQSGIGPADYWNENTTFVVVRSKEDAAEFLARVWHAAGMRRDKDRLIVLDNAKDTGQVRGAVRDNALFEILPFLTASNLSD